MDAQRPGEREPARGGPGAVTDPTQLAALRRMVSPACPCWVMVDHVVPGCRSRAEQDKSLK